VSSTCERTELDHYFRLHSEIGSFRTARVTLKVKGHHGLQTPQLRETFVPRRVKLMGSLSKSSGRGWDWPGLSLPFSLVAIGCGKGLAAAVVTVVLRSCGVWVESVPDRTWEVSRWLKSPKPESSKNPVAAPRHLCRKETAENWKWSNPGCHGLSVNSVVIILPSSSLPQILPEKHPERWLGNCKVPGPVWLSIPRYPPSLI